MIDWIKEQWEKTKDWWKKNWKTVLSLGINLLIAKLKKVDKDLHEDEEELPKGTTTTLPTKRRK